MERVIISRLLLRKYLKKLPLRCYCDKIDKPSESFKITSDQNGNDKKLKESTTDKINELLKAMVVENKMPRKSTGELAKPPGIFHKAKKEVKEDIEQELTKVASEVAGSLGADKEKTEAELLSKVLGKINPSPSQINWTDLIIGMKVDRTRGAAEDFKQDSGAQNVRKLLSKAGEGRFNQKHQYKDNMPQSHFKKRAIRPIPITSDKIFDAEPLGIFRNSNVVNYGTKLDVWDSQFEKELQLSVKRYPDNYFEKMILWTDEGKIWKFPIDNEQGLANEQSVPFTEHIFLDVHLEGWCPETGPVRHFMELVCVGLSKNPYYTVQEKKDHIQWFRDYFMARESLLREVGAMPLREIDAESTSSGR